MRILVLEDEKNMAGFIERGLKEERFSVDIAFDAQKAMYLAQLNQYDVMILDVMLPDKDGFSVCEELRKKKINAPILMLTASNTVTDRVRGLNVGADDYLSKPFAFDEFLARIRALIRRDKQVKTTVLKVADLEMDLVRHKVQRSGREYGLLEYLMVNADEVVTRTMISEHVWNEDFDRFTNVIDVHINALRNKIDKDFKRTLIHTVRGTGYILTDEKK